MLCLCQTIVGLGEVEVSDLLLVETDIPANDDVVLRLRLLQFLVVVSLQLHQRSEDVLVLVRVLVSASIQAKPL